MEPARVTICVFVWLECVEATRTLQVCFRGKMQKRALAERERKKKRGRQREKEGMFVHVYMDVCRCVRDIWIREGHLRVCGV